MTVLLPVGVPGGVLGGPADEGGRRGLVLWAGQARQMDTESYRLWRACGAAPSLEQVVGWAESKRILDPEEIIERLRSERLLIEPSGPELGSLVLRFLGEGAGEGIGVNMIRLKGVTGDEIDVDPRILEALVVADRETPLGKRCLALDEVAGESPGSRETALRESLPVIVRAGVARLDDQAAQP